MIIFLVKLSKKLVIKKSPFRGIFLFAAGAADFEQSAAVPV